MHGMVSYQNIPSTDVLEIEYLELIDINCNLLKNQMSLYNYKQQILFYWHVVCSVSHAHIKEATCSHFNSLMVDIYGHVYSENVLFHISNAQGAMIIF